MGFEPRIQLVEETISSVQPAHQSSGARHRSSSANPDRWRLEEDNFAAGAAAHLNRLMLDGEIVSLFVIADPRTLGELRRHFHDVTSEKLIGDLAKDFTGGSIEIIEAALAKA
jgi:protein required for attachment to host cells